VASVNQVISDGESLDAHLNARQLLERCQNRTPGFSIIDPD
jgi:hypothetical protein